MRNAGHERNRPGVGALPDTSQHETRAGARDGVVLGDRGARVPNARRRARAERARGPAIGMPHHVRSRSLGDVGLDGDEGRGGRRSTRTSHRPADQAVEVTVDRGTGRPPLVLDVR